MVLSTVKSGPPPSPSAKTHLTRSLRMVLSPAPSASGGAPIGRQEEAPLVSERELNGKVEEILRGSFDLHVHARPDPAGRLRMDPLDTGRHAQEAGMAGFVLKSHYYPTAPLADLVNRVYPGLRVAGSVVLNREVGGLNPDAVRAAADLGTRVVWMPTFSADFWLATKGHGPGLRVVDEAGGLLPEVEEILETVRDYDMALATGHVSPQESLALLDAAKGLGIRRLIATHPVGVASAEQLQAMVALGARVELTLLSCMPSRNQHTIADLVAVVKTLGADNCVVSTDFGQWLNPPPAEGMRMAIAELLNAGLGPQEVESLVKTNPLELVRQD